MTDMIANSVQEYVDIALALAARPDHLHELRHSLRPRMAASTLCDGSSFARKMEAAFRTIWKQWCERQPPPDRAAIV
jgi:predicted O-linked N-acetylglucosamine transferase (SPINDLY family)